VNYVYRTSPKDETRIELLQPYINAVLDKSNNWLVYSHGLLLRSRNQLERSKTRERSVLQIQALIDQFKDRETSMGDKTSYYAALDYPFRW